MENKEHWNFSSNQALIKIHVYVKKFTPPDQALRTCFSNYYKNVGRLEMEDVKDFLYGKR